MQVQEKGHSAPPARGLAKVLRPPLFPKAKPKSPERPGIQKERISELLYYLYEQLDVTVSKNHHSEDSVTIRIMLFSGGLNPWMLEYPDFNLAPRLSGSEAWDIFFNLSCLSLIRKTGKRL